MAQLSEKKVDGLADVVERILDRGVVINAE